jgi:ADP-ribosylglycohydrolase/DNA-binding transcriptional regulator YhcF (GntR family)
MVAEEITRDIRSGRFKPGDRLPSEAELGRDLDVARPTVREALRFLEGQKVIMSRHGKGGYVVGNSISDRRSDLFLKKEEALELLKFELVQLDEEGKDVTAEAKSQFRQLGKAGSPEEVELFYDSLSDLPQKADYPYIEPSELDEIQHGTVAEEKRSIIDLDLHLLSERIHGAWLGRCVGCTLGKPVEGWSSQQIEKYLRQTETYPLSDYFVFQPDKLEGKDQPFHRTASVSTRQNINVVPRDDDLDFTILNLSLVAENGYDFSSEDVAESWLSYLPLKMVYTAERQAYVNLSKGLEPPFTASYRNPYREWIGAQIRADAFGYLCPGNPELAARLAFKDARLSHTKNGIYGEMFVAAVIASSLVTHDLREAISQGLAQIPSGSRLHELVLRMLEWRNRISSWQNVMQEVTNTYGRYHQVHTIPNLAIVLIGLLWGEGDFQKTVSTAVMCGMDTDCNGATAGSIFGALKGRSAIPAQMTALFNDRIKSAVFGHSDEKIKSYVEQIMSTFKRRNSSSVPSVPHGGDGTP